MLHPEFPLLPFLSVFPTCDEVLLPLLASPYTSDSPPHPRHINRFPIFLYWGSYCQKSAPAPQMYTQPVRDHLAQIGSDITHSQQDACNLQTLIDMALNLLHSLQKILSPIMASSCGLTMVITSSAAARALIVRLPRAGHVSMRI